MAGKNTYRFKGHESFTIREGWLNKGLFAVSSDSKVFSVNAGADVLGVGPNMAKAIRYWLRCADLTEERQREGVELKWLGKVLCERDPYFEDDLSLWLVHSNIVRNETLATAWSLFFNDFSYEEFDKKILFDEMKELARGVVPDGKITESSVESDCEAILHMYLKRTEKEGNPEEKNVSPFGKYQLLKRSGEEIVRRQPDLTRLPMEAVWYVMKAQMNERTSVRIDELLEEKNSPGKIFQLKRTGLLELLGRLEKEEMITINHTAGLDMVYLKTTQTAEEVVERHYGYQDA